MLINCASLSDVVPKGENKMQFHFYKNGNYMYSKFFKHYKEEFIDFPLLNLDNFLTFKGLKNLT